MMFICDFLALPSDGFIECVISATYLRISISVTNTSNKSTLNGIHINKCFFHDILDRRKQNTIIQSHVSGLVLRAVVLNTVPEVNKQYVRFTLPLQSKGR